MILSEFYHSLGYFVRVVNKDLFDNLNYMLTN